MRAARIYDKLDADTVQKMKASGKLAIYSLPPAEKKKFIDKVSVMEAEWIEKAVQKGLPAREMLDAVHRSVARQRMK